ncbi:odorant receptor 88a [Drosophila tropicalis]|uniref:odorant receptor 88a n=1 Tax=Drosophila tropicalis TaxID=46794 RepID=UPI0035AC1201
MEKLEEEERLVRLEDFLIYCWFQKVSGLIPFYWARDPTNPQRLINTTQMGFLRLGILSVAYFFFNGFGFLITSYLGVPSNQNPPIFSISLYFNLRGLSLYLKRDQIVRFICALDRESAKNLSEQEELQLREVYEAYKKRYLIVSIYSHASLVFFCCLPLGFYFLTNEGPDDYITLDQQLLAGWLPFNMRQNHHLYMVCWTYDMLCTVCGISFFISFDMLFYVMQRQLIMHFDTLTRQISAIDARDSLVLGEEDFGFYAKIYRLASRHQHLNDLCGMYNEIFKAALLVGNFVCATSICLHLYLITETTDLFKIFQFLFPTLALLGFTFDLCLRGTQLEEASGRLQTALYNQNWYMGSRKYRKLMILWLQFAQCTQKLDAYGLIQVNIVHFTDLLQLAYRLFTFLKSQ